MLYIAIGCLVSLLIQICFANDIEHVLLLGIDGLGGEYLSKYLSQIADDSSAINELISYGSYTKYGRNVQPTMSAPNWGTILSGLRPIQSGIFSNSWSKTDMNVIGQIKPTSYDYKSSYNLPSLPTIFDILKQSNPSLITAVSYTWKWFDNFFVDNENIDYLYRESKELILSDDDATDQMIEFINGDTKPNIMFQYFGSVDGTGHTLGWGSDNYYEAVVKVDNLIKEIINALEKNNMLSKTQIILTADHGGSGLGHGDNEAKQIYIPIVFYGKCIKMNNNTLTQNQQNIFIENSDIAPMILNTFHFDMNKLPFIKGKIYNDMYMENCDSDFIRPSISTSNRNDIVTTITSKEQKWGDWSDYVYCNKDTYATAFELDIEPKLGTGDDTGANAFRLICSDGRIIAANNDTPYGEMSIAQCNSNKYIKGFRTRVESDQGNFKDDTALNSVEAICSDNVKIIINGNGWGNFDDNLSMCPTNSLVCGFRQKVESKQGLGDDTGLNGIQLSCCSL